MPAAITPRVNVGCGSTPTPGWVNLDNSLTVKLARVPVLGAALAAMPRGSERGRFVRAARETPIQWAVATRLPFLDRTMELVYSSHMFEHLNRDQATRFLHEAFRVLRPNGLLRLVVPDLKKLVDKYLQTGDADAFVKATLLPPPPMQTWTSRIAIALVGHRGHAWMYDAASLRDCVASAGFTEVTILRPGETRISDPGPLDLRERESESIYLEAVRPDLDGPT